MSKRPVFISPKTILALFLIFGIYLMIDGFFVLSENRKFAEESIETQGLIVDVITITTDNKTKYYHPVVRYTANNGKTYEAHLYESVEKNSIGDSIALLYLAEDPENIHNTEVDLYLDSILMWSFGAVVLLIVFGAGKVVKKGAPTRLKSSYTVDVMAQVTGVLCNRAYSMNGRYAYVIGAVYTDPKTGEEQFVRSKDLWYDPSEYLPEQVHVKVHPEKPKKFWMDTSFLPKRNIFARLFRLN